MQMDCLGDKLFPRPGFTRDEYGGIRHGDPANLFEDIEHGSGRSDDLSGARTDLGDPLPQVSDLLLQRRVVKRPSNSHKHIVQNEGLGDEVVSPKLNGVDGVVACPMGRDNERGEIDESAFLAEETQQCGPSISGILQSHSSRSNSCCWMMA